LQEKKKKKKGPESDWPGCPKKTETPTAMQGALFSLSCGKTRSANQEKREKRERQGRAKKR